MAGPTSLTPDSVHGAANSHRSTKEQVASIQRTVTGQIQQLVSSNPSAMTAALGPLCDEWSQTVTGVLNNLEAMAGQLDKFANDMVNHDTNNAGQVRRIQTTPMSGFLAS
jgi:uncharacterized protein YukE